MNDDKEVQMDAVSDAYEIHKRAMSIAASEFDLAIEKAWAEYNRILSPAREKYERVSREAWSEFCRATGKDFQETILR